jgi:hypothetical protein
MLVPLIAEERVESQDGCVHHYLRVQGLEGEVTEIYDLPHLLLSLHKLLARVSRKDVAEGFE